MNVGFCFNLKKPSADSSSDDLYAEWDDEETIEAVRSALSRTHRVIPIEANEEAVEKFRKLRPDIVFNMAEGTIGRNREAHVPAILEFLGVPGVDVDLPDAPAPEFRPLLRAEELARAVEAAEDVPLLDEDVEGESGAHGQPVGGEGLPRPVDVYLVLRRHPVPFPRRLPASLYVALAAPLFRE